MTEPQLTGVQRAAVLLLSLGELDAAEVLRHMEPKEVQKIGIAMATMTDITREQVERVMDQFGQELGSKTSLGVGSDDYIRNMLVQALGSEKAGNLIDRILLGRNRSEEHTSELQSQSNLVCRLLLEKKKKNQTTYD